MPPESKHKGPGSWKLNTSLLNDKLFCRELTAFLTFWSLTADTNGDINSWWDTCKSKVKALAIKHSVRRNRYNRKLERELENKLSRLKAHQTPNRNNISNIERQLEELIEERLRGVQTRSRALWLEQGEKPTRYFFSLEKRKQAKHTINKLKTTAGEITKDIEILTETRRFYQTLYSSVPASTEDQNFFLRQVTRTLSHDQRNSCEGPITTTELETALHDMHNNKSPGPDGLPVEFYRKFWPLIKKPLTSLFNHDFIHGSLSTTQSSALLRLLFKKDDATLLKNWRPISLLNTDYKILAKAISQRLKRVLPFVIHEDQTCGIPNRSIYENLFRLRDMAYYSILNKTNLILINLDQEKAFDTVNRNFLYKILKTMNFGPSFTTWIKLLYTNTTCEIMNNGWHSDPVHMERGVRQGCPLSPLLYTIVAETLACAIRLDPTINGISIPGTHTVSKILQYADDGTLTLNNDHSVCRSFDLIHRYEQASGSKLNTTKTEGIYVGALAGRHHGPVPIKWVSDSVRVLGTNIGNNLDQDWTEQLEKTKRNLEKWSSRRLTLSGKALLLRTYAIANIIYLASAFVIPGNIITSIHKTIFHFLWDGKNELVSRETCHLPLNRGGLGIPSLAHVNIVSKFKWHKDITDQSNNRLWTFYARYWLGTILSTVRHDWTWLRSLLKPHADPATLPTWYITVKETAQKHRDKLASGPCPTNQTVHSWLLLPLPRPRAERLWNHIQPRPNFHLAWTDIWSSFSAHREQEFLWKCVHRVLPTKSNLANWGMNLTPHCPFCPEREDIAHALLECPRAQTLWRPVATLFEKIIAPQQININMEFIVFGQSLPIGSPAKDLIRFISTLAASIIWQSRNRKVFNQATPNENLFNILRHRIITRIKHDELYHLTRIITTWSINGTFCTYQNGFLKINL